MAGAGRVGVGGRVGDYWPVRRTATLPREPCDDPSPGEPPAAARRKAVGAAGTGPAGYNGGVNLAGKSAVVTGAAVRLGRAIALDLADAGADVLIHCHTHAAEAEEVAGLIRGKGRRAAVVRADLSDPVPAADAVLAAAERAFGRADLLVNSAAIFENAPLAEADEAHWDRHHAINLKAPFFLTRAFAALHRRTAGPHGPGDAATGCVVNLLDWRAGRPPADFLAYTAAKAGLLALTRGFAGQLAPRVRVNGVAPGAMLPEPGEHDDPAGWAARKIPAIPLARVGGAAPVAAAVRYLCEADFVTGEVLHVTGGEEL